MALPLASAFPSATERRNVVVFGKDNYWSSESTIDATGCRWPECHWRIAIKPNMTWTLPKADGSLIELKTKTLLRYRFTRKDRATEVVLLPNEYTLAKVPRVVWKGFVMILNNDSFGQIMCEALF